MTTIDKIEVEFKCTECGSKNLSGNEETGFACDDCGFEETRCFQ